MSDREVIYGEDVEGSSKHAVSREAGADLAYRGVIPRGLGKCLRMHAVPSRPQEDDVFPEEFATAGSPDAYTAEAQEVLGIHRMCWAPLRIASLLVLGIRKIRAEYAERIEAWRSLRRCALQIQSVGSSASSQSGVNATVRGVLLHTLQARVEVWAGSSGGRGCIRELRWECPTLSVLAARLRGELGGLGGASLAMVRNATGPLGIPTATDESIVWSFGVVGWEAVRAAWQKKCSCVGSQPSLSICRTCGGACEGTPDDADVRGLCRWCFLPSEVICSACGRGIHYRYNCSRWLRGASPCFFVPSVSII